MSNDNDPDVGGLDWLKAQLSGAEKKEAPKGSDQAEESGTAPGAAPGAEPGTRLKPVTGDQTGTLATTGAAEATQAAQPGGFNWGLTRNTAPDPKLVPVPPVPPVPSSALGAPGAPGALTTQGSDAAERPGPEEDPPAPEAPDSPLATETTTSGIRSEADLEPAPWWTMPVQTPLVPTADETAATELLRTPVPAASAQVAPTPPPFDAPIVVAAAALGVAPAAPVTVDRGASSRGGSGGGTANTTTRPLTWIAAGLLAVIVLVGLFFLGQKLAGGVAPVASTTPSATSSALPTPAPTVEATGPQPAGVHKWDTLRGGECLQPYTSPWNEEFTVVDCAEGHAGQLVYLGIFTEDATTAFPGEEALATQINLLCSASGVIDLAAAREFPDVQVQGSYPITDEQWTGDERNYYCFVSRSSAEPLTASIAGPGPAPAG